jgi:hypothetical protein
MNIGISQEALVDIGLNMAGFLTAGILMALIYSIFNGRRKVLSVTGPAAPLKMPEGSSVDSAEKSKPVNLEFVDFKTIAWKDSRENRPSVKKPATDNTRNRQEVIRLAKKLLAEKHDEAQLKKNLPITDGELSMVKQTLGDRNMRRRES